MSIIEGWPQFPLVLVVARRKCGMTQKKIGEVAGDLRAVAVNIAIRRTVNRLRSDKCLQQIYRRITAEM